MMRGESENMVIHCDYSHFCYSHSQSFMVVPMGSLKFMMKTCQIKNLIYDVRKYSWLEKTR